MLTASVLAVTMASAPLTSENLATASNAFGAKLVKGVGKGNKNFMISPVSIYSAMALASMGTAGATEKEALAALGLSKATRKEQLAGIGEMMKSLESADPKAKSVIANSLWLSNKYKFHSAYIKEVEPAFRAEVETLDFASAGAAKKVNKWAADKTNNRIKELFKELPADAVAVLVNAIWFKGIWSTPFEKRSTKPQDFTLPGGKKVKASAMKQKEMMRYGETPTARLAEIPYGNKRFTMVVGLPKGTRDPQSALATNLGPLTTLGRAEVNLQLPKWTSKFRWEDVIPALRAAGFKRIFKERQAEFGRMTPADVFISKVVHESWIQVDEEGTEAAAATGAVIMPTSVPMPPKQVDFIVDRPFFYMIRDTQTGLVTFAGVIRDPRS